MSKQNLKKFKKNDFSYDDEEVYETRSNYLEKKKEKRIDRALKTKDISYLLDEDDNEEDWEHLQDWTKR